MTLDDLQTPEKLALVGLSRVLIRADRQFSREEADGLSRIAAELGEDQLSLLFEETAGMTDDQIRQCAGDVVRREARELIYGALYELATAGTIAEAESDFLDWLSDLWTLAAEVDPYRE